MRLRIKAALACAIVISISLATRPGSTDSSDAGAPLVSTNATCPPGFLRVPSGTFTMGAPTNEGEADEHPAHTMTLSGFCMQRLEVTEGDYESCVAVGACTPSAAESMCNSQVANRANHPVNCVDWNQATTYCAYIHARLPTESEWEYAARGTDGRKYPWGNQPPNEHLLNACGGECAAYALRVHSETKIPMYPRSDGFEETAPVGSFPRGASPFGILDMAGNVYEWTSSAYCTYPQHACVNAWRMYRGGAWYTEKTAAISTRNGDAPTLHKVVVGFRCAK